MDNSGWILWVLIILVIGIIVACILLLGKSKEQTRKSEENIARMVNSLPQDKQVPFLLQVNSVRKNPTTAVLLALFFGGLGAHKFYLGKTFAGILYLLFCWTTIPEFIALFEAFSLGGSVAKYNETKAEEYFAMYSGGRISSI